MTTSSFVDILRLCKNRETPDIGVSRKNYDSGLISESSGTFDCGKPEVVQRRIEGD